MSNIDKITLNVGGVYFETNRKTLLKTSEFFDNLLSNEEDVYFVDRDPYAFQIILNFLRQGVLYLVTEDPVTIDFLLTESQFYKLSQLQTDLMQRRLRSAEIASEVHTKQHKMSLSNNSRRNNSKGTGA